MDYMRIVKSNLKRNTKNYITFLLTGIISITLYFLYTTLVYNSGTAIIEKGSILGGLLKSSILIILIILIFFTIYSYTSYIRLRINNFKIMLHVGMTRGELMRCVVLENLFLTFLCLLVGTALGTIFSKVFFLGVMDYLGFSDLKFSLGLLNYISTLTFFVILYIIITQRTRKILNGIDTMNNAGRQKLTARLSGVVKHAVFIMLIALAVMTRIHIQGTKNTFYLYVWIWCMIFIYVTVFYVSSFCIYILKRRKSFYKRHFLFIKQLMRNLEKETNFIFMLVYISFLFITYNWVCEVNVYFQLSEQITDNGIKIFRVIAFFTNLVFFAISSGILYFKCQMEQEDNIQYFKKLYTIGLTKEEYKRLIKYRLLTVFFTPYVLYAITSFIFIIATGIDKRVIRFTVSIMVLSYLFHIYGYDKAKKLYTDDYSW